MFAITFYRCYKCKKISRIVYDIKRGSPITSKPFTSYNKTKEEMNKLFPFFYLDHSYTISEDYYMNHCEFCGAKQGDWYIYFDPLHGMIPEDPNGNPFVLKLFNEDDT